MSAGKSAQIACIALSVFTVMDLVKMFVAIDALSLALDLSGNEQRSVLVVYPLTLATVLLTSGKLGDRGHRKTLLVSGLVASAIGGIIAGTAESFTQVIAGLACQGAGAGAAIPQALGVLQSNPDPRARARNLGWYGTMAGIGLAAGPTISGVLIDKFPEGWRFSIGMGVIPMIVFALIIAFTLAAGAARSPNVPFDIGGTIVFTALVAGLSFTLLTSRTGGATQWIPIVSTVIGAILFVGWQKWRSTHGRPTVISISLLSTRQFSLGIVVGAATFAAVPGMCFLATWYLQNVAGVDAAVAGSVSIPFAAASAITGYFSSRAVAKFGDKLVIVGLVILGLAAASTGITMAFSLHGVTTAGLFVITFILGIGSGLVVSPNQVMSLHDVARHETGTAASLNQLSQRIGTAIGLTSIGAFIWSKNLGLQTAVLSAASVAVIAILIALVSVLIVRSRRQIAN